MEQITSALATGQDRFLSASLTYALQTEWLTVAELLVEFPPAQIMSTLEGAATLRNQLLTQVVGVHEKIAPKKSTGAATEDLTIALAEGVASPEQVFAVLSADECVRHFPHANLWRLLTSSEFWEQDESASRARVDFLLATAEREGLLSRSQILQEIGLERLAEDLPKSHLEAAFASALQLGLQGKSFTPSAFEQAVPRATWLSHLKLSYIFERLIQGVVVPALGFSSAAPQATRSNEIAPSEDRRSVPPAPPSARALSSAESSPSGEAMPSASEPEVASRDSMIIESGANGPELKSGLRSGEPSPIEADERISLEPPTINAANEPARLRAVENLSQLGRLPKHAETLSTPLLLGLDAMCSELRTLSDEDERELCIRDAFPNPNLLREALLCLAEVLDPRLDAAKLEAQGADLDSLVQIVLFEEGRAARLSSNPISAPTDAETLPTPDVRVLIAPPPPAPSARSMPAPPPLPSLSRAKGPKK